jgi:hypothetical protein
MVARWAAAAAAAAVIVACGASSGDGRPPVAAGSSNLAFSVLLSDYAASSGAVCLDGSPQRYWLQLPASGRNARKWFIHMMGGGWCESEASCAQRAFAYDCFLGSSNPACFTHRSNDYVPGVAFNETMDFMDIPAVLGARWGGGLILSDASVNEFTHDWGKVEIMYCDGGSYTGNSENPTVVSFNGTNNVPMYYRGQRNFNAVVDDLTKRWGLGAATDVILSGDSAGGLAVFHHVDHLQMLLPKAAVVAVVDSGFFFRDEASAVVLCGLHKCDCKRGARG